MRNPSSSRSRSGLSSGLLSLVALGALGAGACDVGAVGGPGGNGNPGPGPGPGQPDAQPPPGSPDAAPADFSVALASGTASTQLGTAVHYQVTVTSAHGMAGDVALTATNVPASWQAQLTPATVSLTAGGTATADLQLTIPTDAADLTATVGVSGNGAPGTRTAMGSMLTVAKEVVVTFKDGIGTGDHQLPARIDVLLGTKLRIVDADTKTAHRVHSDATATDGFAHQDADMNAGQEYDVTPTVTGQFRWYCHDHGQGVGVVNLVVK